MGFMLSASWEHDGYLPRAQDISVSEHEGTGLQSSRPLMTYRHRTGCQLPTGAVGDPARP